MSGNFKANGHGILARKTGQLEEALVTDVPITYLGYVNRDTGVIEEPGHPLDGTPIKDTILIYPKDQDQLLLLCPPLKIYRERADGYNQ